MTITDFLLARIAADEALANSAISEGAPRPEPSSGGEVWTALHDERWSPERVLAECEAKRRIVEDHEWDETPGSPVQHSRVLRFLALPYADHPDYRAEWKP